MHVLEVNNACKAYKQKTILNKVSIKCEIGDIIGIYGRNGAGKSTLLKMIFGTIKADHITIKINSESYTQQHVIPSKKIAYLPQDSFLPKNVRVRALIPFFFPDGNAQDNIFYAAEVSRFEKLKIGELSLGQLRYLELLILGNLDHPFLMLDEPFSMIEPLYKDRIKEFLFLLKKTKGILLTDHYYTDVLEVATKNLLLKQGQTFTIKNKEDLYYHNYLKSIE